MGSRALRRVGRLAKQCGGCLALAIILDQLPLNMFRGMVKSFSSEAWSREVARHAIEQGFNKQIDPARLAFL